MLELRLKKHTYAGFGLRYDVIDTERKQGVDLNGRLFDKPTFTGTKEACEAYMMRRALRDVGF